MTGGQIAVVVSMALVALVTFGVGRRTPANYEGPGFGLARRTVRSRRNAAAMSGEFLCVASVLGIAGAVLTDGADAIWYPVGFTAGFLALVIFVAAPLRRSGAYTLPDFVEARLASAKLRGLAGVTVVLISVLYLVPQLNGARLTFTALLPVSPWVGPVAVTVVVLAMVLGGGMRAVTMSLALHYWVKLFAVAAPTLVLLTVFLATGDRAGGLADERPTFDEQMTVTVRTPVTLRTDSATTVRVNGAADVWESGAERDVAAGTSLRFDAGAAVPSVVGEPSGNASWLTPSDDGIGGLLGTYSLLVALVLGAMGLPHILVRFYTNPDGKAARRTALHVVLLAGMFYVFPTLLGALSRLYTPELLVTGETDAAVLLLPSRMLPGVPGQILAAVVVAAVFSAFLAAATGLVFSVAGVVSTGLLRDRVRDVRVAAVLVAVVGLGVALVYPGGDLAQAIVWPFALAASTLCPVLVLGIWWRGLTAKGAAAGMVIGGGIVLGAFGVEVVSGYTGGWAPELVQQPALVSVPAAFLAAVLMSAATKGDIPATVNTAMLRMHAPDTLGFVRETPPADQRPRASEARHRR